LSTTLLVDLEAGDLPVAGLENPSIRPRTWGDCRDLACAIGGPDPARAPNAPYSQGHYDAVIADSTLAGLARYSIIFVDSYTELSRRCRAWAEQQPESFNAHGKKDLRSAYGLVGRELIAWTQQLQHAELARSYSSQSWKRWSTTAAFRVGKSNLRAGPPDFNCRRPSMSSSRWSRSN
jgi:hypothetical protein